MHTTVLSADPFQVKSLYRERPTNGARTTTWQFKFYTQMSTQKLRSTFMIDLDMVFGMQMLPTQIQVPSVRATYWIA